MQTRRFGRTGHNSTVAIFGSFAFSEATQPEADAGMELIIQAGVNHIDVAPTYGLAEERLGPWMRRERERFFLGCKTIERDRNAAAASLRRSMQLLQVERFDLFQIHGVTTMEELDASTRSGGALDAILKAKEAGLTDFVGITGHGHQAPAVFLEALRRYDFDSVLFALNPFLYSMPEYRRDAEELLRQCRAKDVGVMIIKTAAREPWKGRPKTHKTWYAPFTESADIQARVNFCLSQDVTGLCNPGDLKLLPLFLHACEHFTPLGPDEQEALIAADRQLETIF